MREAVKHSYGVLEPGSVLKPGGTLPRTRTVIRTWVPAVIASVRDLFASKNKHICFKLTCIRLIPLVHSNFFQNRHIRLVAVQILSSKQLNDTRVCPENCAMG